jgi:pimeloyl-ACP methyl ester carboxylesterase
MVGHSLGGPYVMAFTREYDSEVAGMVLVDPSHPDQFPLFRQVTGKGMEPDPTEVRVGALLAWTGVLRLLLPEDAPGGAVQVSRAAPAFLPMSLGELARETSAIPLLLSQTGEFRSLGDRPLIVLTATLPHTAAVRQIMGVTPAQDSALLAISRRLHEDQAHWSTRGEHVLVERASHYIQFDRPDAVVAAVRSVVQRSR